MALIQPIQAKEVAESKIGSAYPEPFALMVKGRSKRKLGDHFGPKNFGVNLTKLSPGAMSALKHQHLKQDEFIYILSGMPTLIYGEMEYPMIPGECFGFKSGNGVAHHLVNRSDVDVVYLEVGDRLASDRVEYPDNDLIAESDGNARWALSHKNGKPY